jgi:hypothetical protein
MIRASLKFNAAAFNRVIAERVEPLLRNTLEKIADRMKFLFRLPKSGRVYGKHQASAPGEAPAIRSRRLTESISQPIINGLTGRLEVRAPYAGLLEKGTDFMQPRPFAEVAARSVVSRLNQQSFFNRL